MPTKKEYAISLGLARPGRGRMSREAHAAIQEAIKKGMTFSDSSEAKTQARMEKVAKREEKADARAKAKAEEKSGAGVAVMRAPRGDRPDGFYTFANPDGTTFQRLHTNACMSCHYSFQWCLCPGGPVQFATPFGAASGEVAILVAGPNDPAPKGGRRRRG